METFSALLAICAGNSPVRGEFPTQRPLKRSFDVYFDLRPNKRLSIQSLGWWFETLSPPLWRHRNVTRLQWQRHYTFAGTHMHTYYLLSIRVVYPGNRAKAWYDQGDILKSHKRFCHKIWQSLKSVGLGIEMYISLSNLARYSAEYLSN